MAHGELQRESAEIVADCREVGGGETETRHSGIELDDGWQPAVSLPRLRRPSRELVDAVADGQEVMCETGGLAARKDAVHDVDRRISRQRMPERDAFLEMGDEEMAATGGQERRRHRGGAETIRIGLDDCAALGRADPLLQEPVISRDRAEIDCQQSTGCLGTRIARR